MRSTCLAIVLIRSRIMRFRLVPMSLILNDLERRNNPYFALFHRIRVTCRRETIIRLTSVSKSTFDSLTILIPSAQLFSDYLGKTNSDDSVYGRRCIDDWVHCMDYH